MRGSGGTRLSRGLRLGVVRRPVPTLTPGIDVDGIQSSPARSGRSLCADGLAGDDALPAVPRSGFGNGRRRPKQEQSGGDPLKTLHTALQYNDPMRLKHGGSIAATGTSLLLYDQTRGRAACQEER